MSGGADRLGKGHAFRVGMSLRFELILAFLAIAIALTGVSFYQIRSVQHFNNSFLALVDNFFPRVDALDEVKLLSIQMHDQTFGYQRAVFEGKQVDAAKQRAALVSLGDELRAGASKYRSLVASDKNNEAAAITTATNNVIASSLAVSDATTSDTSRRVPEALQDQLASAQDQLTSHVDRALTSERQHVAVADADVDSTVAQLQNIIVFLAAGGIALALGLGFFVASWIARSLSVLKAGALRIANGDFSRPIDVRSRDEIGQLGRAFNDMSGRLKEAYQRQAYAQQRDEAILLSMGEGLVAIDASGIVTLINGVASELLDLTEGQTVVGQPINGLYQLYPADGKDDQPLPRDEHPSFVALSTGQPASGVFSGHRKVGGKVLLSITSSPILTDGEVIGVVTILRDVTKEREVDRMKTEFISLASHQLRTPLSAIKWFSEMLVSGDAGKLSLEQLDFANNIASSTERMIDLVNALLNISRIESGRIMVVPQPTDLKELVSGIVNDLKAKTEEKQQSLVISVHDDLPKVNLDPRLIGQVYLNLLSNAVKYTQKGGEISVFISRKDDQIISQVTDNGYGIPKAQQERVFQKFFRAANAVKVETDGTGLGLYLIKAIVESSGGKIWFQSEEGKGTTFWFSMPMSGMKPKEGEVTLDV